jgi:hypothetical protein
MGVRILYGIQPGCFCMAWFSCSLNNLDDNHHQLRVLSRILRRNQWRRGHDSLELDPANDGRAQGLRRTTLRVFAALAQFNPTSNFELANCDLSSRICTFEYNAVGYLNRSTFSLIPSRCRPKPLTSSSSSRSRGVRMPNVSF